MGKSRRRKNSARHSHGKFPSGPPGFGNERKFRGAGPGAPPDLKFKPPAAIALSALPLPAIVEPLILARDATDLPAYFETRYPAKKSRHIKRLSVTAAPPPTLVEPPSPTPAAPMIAAPGPLLLMAPAKTDPVPAPEIHLLPEPAPEAENNVIALPDLSGWSPLGADEPTDNREPVCVETDEPVPAMAAENGNDIIAISSSPIAPDTLAAWEIGAADQPTPAAALAEQPTPARVAVTAWRKRGPLDAVAYWLRSRAGKIAMLLAGRQTGFFGKRRSRELAALRAENDLLRSQLAALEQMLA